MRHWVWRVVVGMLSIGAAADAQSFTGSWTSEVGSLTLEHQGARVTGSVNVAGVAGAVTAAAQGTTFSGTYSAQGETGTLRAQLQGDELRVTFDDAPPVAFRRTGVAEAAPGAGGAALSAGTPSRAVGVSAPRVAPADGAEVRAEAEGWAARAPAKWKFKVEANRVLFGSDTEAGMIVASFRPGATFEEMQQAATQGFSDSGLMLTPTGAPQGLEVKGARAVAVDLQTTGPDGVPLSVRAAGVIGGGGGVAIIGLTTAEKFALLRGRVDQIARSVTFFAPKVPAGANLLRGALCSYSGGSVASFSSRYTFDGRGHVSRGSEMVAGGQFNDGMGNSTGSWSAVSGNQNAPDSLGTYVVQGNAVTIQLGGNVYSCQVHFRQQSGQITELKCGEKLFGTGLCE